ncbi:MAG: hypothetical protein AAB342_03020 [Chloroflexota bacterium]
MRSPLHLNTPDREPDFVLQPRKTRFVKLLVYGLAPASLVMLFLVLLTAPLDLSVFARLLLFYGIPPVWHEPLHYLSYRLMGIPARLNCIRTWLPKDVATFPASMTAVAAAPIIANAALCAGAALFMPFPPLAAVTALFYVVSLHASDLAVIRHCLRLIFSRAAVSDDGSSFRVWITSAADH